MKSLALAALLLPPLPLAAQDMAGAFDHYVLALSWSPGWCATRSQGPDAPQCAPGRRLGFVVHGLWPQRGHDWPEWCETAKADPSHRDSRAMEDVMPSAGLAWHQWKKHGRCSGLSGADYYWTVRRAADSIAIPPLPGMPAGDLRLDARAIEDAFIGANSGLTRDGITVTCRDGRLAEVRICLTRDLEPRACAPHARRDCRSPMRLEAPAEPLGRGFSTP